jgi:Kelch motif protein
MLAGVLVLAACGGGHSSVRGPGTTIRATTTTAAKQSIGTSSTVPVSAAPAAPAQRVEPPMPVALQEGAGATVPGRFYAIGGFDTSRRSRNLVFVFDGSTWAPAPDLPIAVNHPAAAAIGDDVYVAGGFTAASATNRVFVLHKDAPSWADLTPMRRARGALSLLAINGRLYAIGGRDSTTEVAVAESFDPRSNTWTDLPSMPDPRNHLAGYIDGGLACVAGGRTPATTAAVDCFDPARSAWQRHVTLPNATSGAAAAVLHGTTIVAGGELSGEARLVPLVQELHAGTWTSQRMIVPRHGMAFAIFQGRLWACGGATAPAYAAVATCTSFGG